MTSSAREQALTFNLLKRAELWRQAEARARRFARGHTDDAADAIRMADDYRLLAHDLARARTLLPGTRTREYLEAAYVRAHATLHHGAWQAGSALLSLFRDEIPAVVRSLLPYIFWSTLIFVLAACAGYALVHRYPELIALFASPDLIASVERGKLWTEGLLNIVPSSVLSVEILTNNIVVSLFAYCAGFFFGLGTLYILGLNGLMLGAVFAFVSLYGLRDQLASFVIAHGCVEISVVCLSGAAGAAVGESLIRPGEGGRIESFRVTALRSGKLLIACALLLVGAGLLEGYVSPDPRFPFWSRVALGVGYWLFMVALLSGWLFGRPRARRVA
ncbi:MAG TPA: stage II sporulation protein M [Steroidobacteraceae bacterium]|nr:stage II sporulation protein M [Steroidobacteraceae bacterium]